MNIIVIYDCSPEHSSYFLDNGIKMLGAQGAKVQSNAGLVACCFSSQLAANSFHYKHKKNAVPLEQLKSIAKMNSVVAAIVPSVQKAEELFKILNIAPPDIYSMHDSQWISFNGNGIRQQTGTERLKDVSLAPMTFSNGSMPKVAVVLPTYGNEEETMKFFKSFFDCNSMHFNCTIYWVDNGSTQDSINKVNNYLKKKKADNVKIEKIRKPEPLGYAPAVNIGISRALEDANDWIVLQNNDTQATEEWWLDELIDLRYDAVVPLTDVEDSVQCKKSIIKHFPEAAKSIGKRGAKVDASSKDGFIPTTFCAAIHSSVFKKIGMIDENFKPGYGEDTDFFLRMKAAKMKIGIALGAEVKHVHGATFDETLSSSKKLVKKLNLQQCFIKNKLSNPSKKKAVIYTCITNGFEKLTPFKKYDSRYDYVLFTDDTSKTRAPDSNWTTIDISAFGEKFSNDRDKLRKLARFIKINPQMFLGNYEVSVWFDGNVSLGEPAYKVIEDFISSKDKLLTTKHPERDCLYDEAKACLEFNKETQENISKVLELYKKLEVPKHLGLIDSKFMLRKHNDKEVVALMEDWMSYVKDYTKRDQLSFNLVCWLDKFEYKAIPLENLFKNEALFYLRIHFS